MGKEEDKIEKLIRGLLKLPGNRRCINCNSLGPQYVCTTFWTFVCTNCSGVHREFIHRVKSVSMAKFSMEEVNSLQAGGNEKAREIYFKTWNPHRNFFPDNSNIQKLREFIKQVYVDRRYTGENHPVLHPRIRNSDKDESCEWTRQDSLRERGSDGHRRYAIDEPRSPGYPRETDDRYCRYSNNEVRSPGYSRENSRHAGLRASSSRFEGTECSYQVDDARIAGRSATHMFTTEDIKPRRKSPPPVRDVRAVLGDKFVSLRVGDQTKKSVFGPTNGEVRDHGGQNSPRETGDQSKTAHKRTVSAYVQNTVQPGNKTPVINSSLKAKRGSEGSLIDFASFPPPPPPPEASTQNQELQMQVSEPSLKKQLCNVPPPPKNTLEFLLFELSAPAEIPPSDQSGPQTCEDTASIVPSKNSSTLHDVPAEPNNSNDSSTLHLALASTQEFLNTPNASTDIPQSRHAEEPKVATPQMVPDFLSEDSVSSFNETSKDQAPSNDQLGNSCASGLDSSSAAPQPSHLHENSNHKEATLFPAASAEFAVANSTTQSLLSAKTPSHETNATVRSSARAELPEDLFASLYPSRTMSTPGWQMSPSYGMGFNMEYYQNAPMQTPPFSNVAKSVNPFDTNDDEAQPQLNTISSMPILHGGLAPAGILRTQSFETHLQRFSSAQLPSFQPGGYMAPFPSICIQPSRQQEIGGFGSGVATGPIYLNQHPHQNPASADLRPFPTNPFG